MKSDNNFEHCMKCSICTVYCPMMDANPGFQGPKQSGPDGERYRLKDAAYYDEALTYCLNCKRCEVACPSDVKIGDIIQNARFKYGTDKPKLRDKMLASTDLVGSVASAFAPVVNPIVSSKPAKAVMDSVMGIDHRRTFPKYSKGTFESWYRKHAAEHQKTFAQCVSYFHGCYVNYNFPELGRDLVKILNAVGYGVKLLDGEKCCGVALIANGMKKAATKHAVANMKALRKAQGKIVSTSSSCTMTLRNEYPEILEIDNSDVREDILLSTRFLFELVDRGEVKLAFRDDYHKRIAYHTPCHLSKLGWGIYSVNLLKMIPGVELEVLDQQCCGIAGTFGFKKEYYDYSQKIGEKLFSLIRQTNPDVVATDCETCKWQIEMSMGVTVLNPISVIAAALDVEQTEKLNRKGQ